MLNNYKKNFNMFKHGELIIMTFEVDVVLRKNVGSVSKNSQSAYQELKFPPTNEELALDQLYIRQGEYAQARRNRDALIPKSRVIADQETFAKKPTLQIPSPEKVILTVAEFNYQKDNSKKNWLALQVALEKVIYVLESTIKDFSELLYGEYGDLLGVGLTQPLAEAKSDLDSVKKRLAELKNQGQSKHAAVKTPDVYPQNVVAFFNPTYSKSETAHYQNQDVVDKLKNFSN
jgi:hypothetical protein